MQIEVFRYLYFLRDEIRKMVWRGNVWGVMVGKPEGNTPLVMRPVLGGIILQNRKCTFNTD
jgi:hypothetical protein